MAGRVFRNRVGKRRGATVVEFAICLPVLLLLFFGAIEFSRVNMLRHTVAEAAYEGARRGIVPGATATEARNEAISVLGTVKANDYTVTVTPATITADTPEVTVSISLPLDKNSWVAALYMGGQTMTKSFTMRREKYETATVP